MSENNEASISTQGKLSTEPYKGVRDFYPEDMAIQNYIFNVWKRSAEKFGYQEYTASILEPAELYKAKSGDEIVNEQTYTFKDRGDREVTIRPEMTPTVARMVAAKKRELAFPLRWYSIPNLFRYEKPQRGRLREHWQLNVDIFGVENIQAEVDVIGVAYDIMKSFGIKDADFEIRINNRIIMNYLMHNVLSLSNDKAYALSKLIDKKDKISREDFEKKSEEIIDEKNLTFLTAIHSANFEEFISHLAPSIVRDAAVKEIRELIASLEALGVTNVVFDQTLMRGFDYYTGIVFEIYDKNPDNRRALFGGGRYNDLLTIFGQEKVPAVGFGMGDVTIRDVLSTYNLLPKKTISCDLYIAVLGENAMGYAQDVAQTFREKGLRVALDYTSKKVGDQIKTADKLGAANVIVIGDNEMKSGKFTLKNLATGEQKEISKDYQIK